MSLYDVGISRVVIYSALVISLVHEHPSSLVLTVSDSDTDDELFDRLDLAPARKKIGLDPEIQNGE